MSQNLCFKKHRSTSFLAVIIPAFFVYIVMVCINFVAKARSNINMRSCYVNKELFLNINNAHHSTKVPSDYSFNNTSEARRISYSKDLLLSINTKATMPSADLLNHLSYLGVNKHIPKKGYRGKRAGRRKQRAIGVTKKNPLFPLQVYRPRSISVNCSQASWNTYALHKRGVNAKNLTKIRCVDRPIDLKIGLLNIQSCRNKVSKLQELILEEHLDILFLTETWLKEAGDEHIIADLTPSGFSMRSFPRKGKRGGGVAVIFRSSLSTAVATEYVATTHETFEAFSFPSPPVPAT